MITIYHVVSGEIEIEGERDNLRKKLELWDHTIPSYRRRGWRPGKEESARWLGAEKGKAAVTVADAVRRRSKECAKERERAALSLERKREVGLEERNTLIKFLFPFFF